MTRRMSSNEKEASASHPPRSHTPSNPPPLFQNHHLLYDLVQTKHKPCSLVRVQLEAKVRVYPWRQKCTAAHLLAWLGQFLCSFLQSCFANWHFAEQLYQMIRPCRCSRLHCSNEDTAVFHDSLSLSSGIGQYPRCCNDRWLDGRVGDVRSIFDCDGVSFQQAGNQTYESQHSIGQMSR